MDVVYVCLKVSVVYYTVIGYYCNCSENEMDYCKKNLSQGILQKEVIINLRKSIMAKTDYKTINQYHKVFPKEIQERMQSIREVIHKAVPEAEEVISYQIPCFKYKGYLIYYSAYAKHISLSYPFSEALLKKFEKELKKLKVSKSAIQFPNDETLPLDLIRRIIEFRKKENEEKN